MTSSPQTQPRKLGMLQKQIHNLQPSHLLLVVRPPVPQPPIPLLIRPQRPLLIAPRRDRVEIRFGEVRPEGVVHRAEEVVERDECPVRGVHFDQPGQVDAFEGEEGNRRRGGGFRQCGVGEWVGAVRQRDAGMVAEVVFD